MAGRRWQEVQYPSETFVPPDASAPAAVEAWGYLQEPQMPVLEPYRVSAGSTLIEYPGTFVVVTAIAPPVIMQAM